MKYKMPGLQQGFSLIETLVVLIIFGFVTAITVPMLSKQLQEYRLMRSTREVLGNVQMARLKAVSNNFNYAYSFTRSTSTYQVSGTETVGPDGVFHNWNDANGNGVQDTDNAYETNRKLVYGSFGTTGITVLPNLSAVGTPPATIKITFKPDGTVDQTATSTTYRCVVLQNIDAVNTQAVCVDNDGFIKIWKRNGTSWKELK